MQVYRSLAEWSGQNKLVPPFETNTDIQIGFRVSDGTQIAAMQKPGQGINAKALYEKYVAIARAAALTGDAVEPRIFTSTQNIIFGSCGNETRRHRQSESAECRWSAM